MTRLVRTWILLLPVHLLLWLSGMLQKIHCTKELLQRLINDYYRLQTKFGARQCFYTCVSFCSPGVGFPACITGHMIRGVCIRGGGGADPPAEIHGILQDTVNKRVVRILLECFLVS